MSPHSGISRVGTYSLLAIATLTIMVGSVIAPSLPRIAETIGLREQSGWLLTLPALGVVILGAPAGLAIDRFGARNAVIAGLVLYGLLGVLGAAIPSVFLLLLDRFLLGGATALVMAGGTTLISDFFEGHARLVMLARQGMAIELGGVVFLSLGGVLAELGWRLPFMLYLVAWAFILLVLRFVPEPRRVAASSTPRENANLTGIADILVAATCAMTLFFTAFISLPAELSVHGFSEAHTGYYLAFISLIAVLAAALLPAIQKRVGSRSMFLLAFASFALGHLVFSLHPPFSGLVVAAIFMGTGFGFSIPLANHEIVERSRQNQRGRHLAILSVSIFLGQFLSSIMEVFAPTSSDMFTLSVAIAGIAAMAYLACSILISRRAPQPNCLS